MVSSVRKCAAALVIVSAAIVASLASPADVELDKEARAARHVQL